MEDVQTIENNNGTPIMYAINLANNNGFVVLSASIVEKPILAYNQQGRFDFANWNEVNGGSSNPSINYIYNQHMINNINPK
ncbi:Spi family protease inhibitor [Capnocytophaga sp. ARDL2]|uniref:Spi family protease inhibitor n=1 Tax=Capnocytophaga sp. ARDL2 TaxID=3238809 RepID=UPI003557382D